VLFSIVHARGNLHWYDLVIIGIAAAIVYPDKVLDWIGDRTGWSFKWPHVLLVVLIAAAAMWLAMLCLMPLYPRLHWWQPLLSTGMLTIFRLLMALVVEIVGLKD
jgi:hypothetical protein